MNRSHILVGAVFGGVGLGVMATGSMAAYKHWEEVRNRQRQTTEDIEKALNALKTNITPEDRAITDAYTAMIKRWDEKVRETTNGRLHLDTDCNVDFLRK